MGRKNQPVCLSGPSNSCVKETSERWNKRRSMPCLEEEAYAHAANYRSAVPRLGDDS
jgi:hypothetical protein